MSVFVVAMFNLHVVPLRIEWCFQRAMQILCTRPRECEFNFWTRASQHAAPATPAAAITRPNAMFSACLLKTSHAKSCISDDESQCLISLARSQPSGRGGELESQRWFCASGASAKTQSAENHFTGISRVCIGHAALNQCNFGVDAVAALSLLGPADVAACTHIREQKREFCVWVPHDERIFVILIYPPLSAAAAAHSHTAGRVYFLLHLQRVLTGWKIAPSIIADAYTRLAKPFKPVQKWKIVCVPRLPYAKSLSAGSFSFDPLLQLASCSRRVRAARNRRKKQNF